MGNSQVAELGSFFNTGLLDTCGGENHYQRMQQGLGLRVGFGQTLVETVGSR